MHSGPVMGGRSQPDTFANAWASRCQQGPRDASSARAACSRERRGYGDLAMNVASVRPRGRQLDF